MAVRRKVPLAWKNLTHEPRRLVLAVGGIAFAVLLMFMQLGFRNALFDSTVELLRKFNADLVITHRARYTLSIKETFPRQRLYQAMGCSGVEAAWPLYLETRRALLKNPEEGKGKGKGYPIRVLAFDPALPVLNIEGLAEHASQLRLAGTALFDLRSKRDYGIRLDEPGAPPVKTELAGQSVTLVGGFRLGTDFANDGNMIMSAENFRHYFAGGRSSGLDAVDIGLIKLAPKADLLAAQQCVRGTLKGTGVDVLTRQEFEERERAFWKKSTPIGVVFGLGTVMGFVVGVIICYQILYADIADHLSEFATLKAMGYGPPYFIGLVLEEALILSLLGFLPGLLVSHALYTGLAEGTGLLLRMTPGTMGLVLILTVGLCVLSGCLSIRKVLAADPAELF